MEIIKKLIFFYFAFYFLIFPSASRFSINTSYLLLNATDSTCAKYYKITVHFYKYT